MENNLFKLFSKQVSCQLNNGKVHAVFQSDQNHKNRWQYNVALNPAGSTVQKVNREYDIVQIAQ